MLRRFRWRTVPVTSFVRVRHTDYGLRAYRGVPPSVWGGDPAHEHVFGALERGKRKDMLPADQTASAGRSGMTDKQDVASHDGGRFCACGAWRGCLGNEPDPQLYVAHMVACFREVRRVLRDDGVCWLNLGDSFSASGGGKQTADGKRVPLNDENAGRDFARGDRTQPSNLLGIPWMVAFALQADGWILRNDIIFAKRSAMPESVSGVRWERHRVKVASGTVKRDGMNGSGQRPHGAAISEPQRAGAFPDRPQQNHDGHEFLARAAWRDCDGCEKCHATDGYVLRRGSWRHTRAHEVVFMLAKTADYYCDADAAKEDAIHDGRLVRASGRNARNANAGDVVNDRRTAAGFTHHDTIVAGRNPRTWMLLGPEPLKAAHFAAMPTALVEPLLLASTSARGCCAKCGAPHARVVERGDRFTSNAVPGGGAKAEAMQVEREAGGLARLDGGRRDVAGSSFANNPAARPTGGDRTIAWRATCACADAGPPVPCVVMDPFAGSGTVGRVAIKHRRRAVLLDASGEYLREIADDRTRGVQVELGMEFAL